MTFKTVATVSKTILDMTDAYTVVLTNESHVVACDKDGLALANEVGSAGLAKSSILVYKGSQLLNAVASAPALNQFSYTIGTATNCTAARTNDNTFYVNTVDSNNSGSIAISVNIEGEVTVNKVFNYSKSKTGQTGTTGSAGQNATSYWLVTGVPAIAKSIAGVYTPASLTVTSKSQTGTGAPANYSGRFIIAETTDGSTYVDKYTSSIDENTKAYTPTAGIKAIRVRMYLAGGVTTLLDEQVVPIVSDGATGNAGSDSYSAVLSNDAVNIPTDSAGNNAVLTGANTTVYLYKGVTSKTPTLGTLVTSGCTATAAGAVVTITAVSADTGYVDIPILDGAVSVGTKRFSFAKSKQGNAGTNGTNGVSYRNMGAWINTTAYVNDTSYIDTVNYMGSLYACKTSNTGQLPTNATYWTLLVQKGDLGGTLNWNKTNMTMDNNYRAYKSAGSNSVWDASINSVESFKGDCVLTFKPNQANQYFMMGLNTDPTLDSNYTSLDFAFYLQSNGNLNVFESNVDKGTVGTYVAGDLLQIVYEGTTIKYYKNGTLLKTTTTTAEQTFYVDSSFYTITTTPQVYAITCTTSSGFEPSLDWVQKWDGLKTSIMGESILSPKIFAGINGGTSVAPVLTGIAIGRDVLGGTDSTIGIVGYNANAVNFQLKTDGSAVFGKNVGRQFIINADGSVVVPKITAQEIEVGSGEVATGNIAIGKTVSGIAGISNTAQMNDGDTLAGGAYCGFGSGSANNNAAESAYVQYDLGQVYRITESRIFFYAGDARSYWYKIKYSVDGVTWYYAIGNSANNGWVTSPMSVGSGVSYFPTIDNFAIPIAARYIRVYANGNTINTGNHIHEWELYCGSGKTIVTGGQIYGGTLTLGGSSNGNGMLSLKNSSSVEIVKMDNTGIVVDQGSYRLKDIDGSQYTINAGINHVLDHGFELIAYDNATYDATHNDETAIDTKNWIKTGSPKINLSRADALFGSNCVAMDLNNYLTQYVSTLISGKTYTFSAYVYSHKTRNVAGSPVSASVVVTSANSSKVKIADITSATKLITSSHVAGTIDTICRIQVTFIATADYYTRFDLKGAGAGQWVFWDGVQVSEGSYPSLYETDSQLWKLATGNIVANDLQSGSFTLRSNYYAPGKSNYININNNNMVIGGDLPIEMVNGLSIDTTGNPYIELRAMNGGTAYIDFSLNSSEDYRARLYVVDTYFRTHRGYIVGCSQAPWKINSGYVYCSSGAWTTYDYSGEGFGTASRYFVSSSGISAVVMTRNETNSSFQTCFVGSPSGYIYCLAIGY